MYEGGRHASASFLPEASSSHPPPSPLSSLHLLPHFFPFLSLLSIMGRPSASQSKSSKLAALGLSLQPPKIPSSSPSSIKSARSHARGHKQESKWGTSPCLPSFLPFDPTDSTSSKPCTILPNVHFSLPFSLLPSLLVFSSLTHSHLILLIFITPPHLIHYILSSFEG